MTALPHLLNALPLALTGVLLFIVVALIRRGGPVGLAHGIIDWNQVALEGQHAVGRYVARWLYLMGLVMLATSTALAVVPREIVPWLALTTATPAVLMVIALVIGVPRIARRYPVSLPGRHERR